MHADVIRNGSREAPDEVDRIVAEEVIPALREEPGFAAALSLVDRETGRSMMIVLWTTVATTSGDGPVWDVDLRV